MPYVDLYGLSAAPFGFQQTVLVDKSLADKTIIGTNSACKYIFLKAFNGSSSLAEHWNDAVNQLVDIEETLLATAVASAAKVNFQFCIYFCCDIACLCLSLRGVCDYLGFDSQFVESVRVAEQGDRRVAAGRAHPDTRVGKSAVSDLVCANQFLIST